MSGKEVLSAECDLELQNFVNNLFQRNNFIKAPQYIKRCTEYFVNKIIMYWHDGRARQASPSR
jgi:hypothetical protein